MTDRELLEQIVTDLGGMKSEMGKMNTRMDSMENKIDSMENRISNIENDVKTLKTDIQSIKEDTTITRGAVNSLVEWTEEVAVITQIKFPLSKIG